jgi:hypothetical protein
MLFFHLRLALSSDPLHVSCLYLLPHNAPHPSHSIFPKLATLIFGKTYKSKSSSLCSFLKSLVMFSLLGADMAVHWLRQVVAGLPSRRPDFDPGSVHMGFVVDKVALGQVLSPSTSVFPCQFHSICSPLLGKGQKIIFTFITGLHKKP